MMLLNNYFVLYGNCILVKGGASSIICDLNCCCYLPLSNLLFDVVHTCEFNGYSIAQLKHHYNGQYDQGIDGLFDYLNDKGYGFFTTEPELFPKVSLEWDAPYAITNSIVEIDGASVDLAHEAILQLNIIGCQAVELRCLEELPLEVISALLQSIEQGRTSCVFLYTKYSSKHSFEDVANLYLKHSVIGQLIIHSAPESNDFKELLPDHMHGRIRQVKRELHGNSKDVISPETMIINMQSFTEANSFNLGLNRKVSITSKGEIKRYPNHKELFGIIGKDSIAEVIKQDTFQRLWHITKDKVEVCKDCQYRYMCVDNSELLEVEGKFIRDRVCNFDPYKNIWNS